MNIFTKIPSQIEPAYNQFWFQTTSNKTAEEGFNFIFDLGVEGETGTTRTRLNPRPAENNTIYSPANILESKLGFDSDETITGATASIDAIRKYNVQLSESYVVYWSFYDNYNSQSINPSYSAGTLFSGATAHNFKVGDIIIINQDPGYTFEGYNGTHTIIQVPSPNMIVIGIGHISTPVNGGTAVIYTKIPTIFTSTTVCYDRYTLLGLTPQYPSCGSNDIVNEPEGWVFNYAKDCGDPATFKLYDATTLQFSRAYKVTIQIINFTKVSPGDMYAYVTLGGVNISGEITANGTYTFYGNTNASNKTIEFNAYFNNPDLTGTDNQFITYALLDVCEITDYTGYTYNGVIAYENYPSYSFPNFYEFMTDAPSIQKIRFDEEATLSYWNELVYENGGYVTGTTSGPTLVTITTTNTTGGTQMFEITNSPTYTTGNTTNRIINHFGIGPVNLNKIDEAYMLLGAQPIITDDIVSYSIYLQNNVGGTITETLTYKIDDKCSKFDKIRFQWQNQEGQADYYTSYQFTTSNLNVERNTYNKFLGYDYRVGDAGTTIFNIDANKTYSTTTDWLNEDTYNWLINIYKSPVVYATINGIKYPVIVEDTTAPYSSPNRKLKQLTINFRLANKVNTQR
jgi:hypothetical protein